MLLLLSCLTGAWAQEPTADETPPSESPEVASPEPGADEEAAPENENSDTGEDEADPSAPAEPATEPASPSSEETAPAAQPVGSNSEPDVEPEAPSAPATVVPVPLTPPPRMHPLMEQATPYGLVQVWGTAWDQDQTAQADPAGYSDPEDDPGFKIRRARIGLAGSWGEVGYRVGVGYSSGFDGIDTRSGIEIIEAEVNYELHQHVDARAGVMKIPFGRDNAVASSQLVLGERGMISNHITPDRDVGLVIDGGAKGVRVQAGLFNGNANLAGDDNPGVLALTRVSYDHGPANTYESFGTAESLSFSVGGNAAYNWDTATTELAYGVDFGLRVADLAVLLDLQGARITPANSTIDQPDVLKPTTRNGAVLQVSYTLRDLWEPAVRLEWFDADPETEGNEVALASVGFTAHLADNRLQAGAAFVHRQEINGPTILNDTLRGFVQVVW